MLEVWERTLTEQETPAGDGNTRDAGPRWLGALRFTSEGLTSALERLGGSGVRTQKPGGACAGHEALPPPPSFKGRHQTRFKVAGRFQLSVV